MVKLYKLLYCQKCGKTVKTKKIKRDFYCRRCGSFIKQEKELGLIGS